MNQAIVAKLAAQIMNGCQKPICFNKYCKRNILQGTDVPMLNESDAQMMAQQAVAGATDASELLCVESVMHNEQKCKKKVPYQELLHLKNVSPSFIMQNVEWFCCSFVKQAEEEDVQQEVSAFDEEAIIEAATSVPLYLRKMQANIKALKSFYNTAERLCDSKQEFMTQVSEMIELISFYSQQQGEAQRLMCARGLLLLLHLDQLESFHWLSVSVDLAKSVNEIYSQPDSMPMQFLQSLSSQSLLQYVMRIQALITLQVATGDIDLEQIEQTIKMLDLFYRVNKSKCAEDQIPSKEFHNEAINTAVDLKPQMAEWAKQTKIQVRNGQPVKGGGPFMLCNYHWILNTHNKNIMIQEYNKMDWNRAKDQFLLRYIWDKKKVKESQNYVLEVNRDKILEDSLLKIVKVLPVAGLDPLKLPLKINFEKEPGIDVGGVRKEYFSLIMRELFNPAYAMFKFNEDTHLYWFNGSTFEPNLNFELVGNLMGLAFYNNMFIDMPVVPACYKILLGLQPDLNDMAQWQPETAKSLKFILDYKESENGGAKLEDIVCRSFSVDVQQFGAVSEVELVPGGSSIPVTQDNRHDFVRLYIDYEFQVQCQQQLNSFKKGFNRIVDIQVLQTILTPEDLEQLICGQRSLDFQELRDHCHYAGGYTPECKLVQWFWEIVLSEWDDEKRRQLLTFATGSDRAPVNGLKSMKFWIVREEENVNDSKLPTSHTCFNQLCLPVYSRKEILRAKLSTAIENATGFGMI